MVISFGQNCFAVEIYINVRPSVAQNWIIDWIILAEVFIKLDVENV